jgi:sulfur-oxidizing protein SoxY
MLLAFGAASAALALAPTPIAAQQANNHAEMIKKFVGDKEVKAGRITLELPEIAENGNTVPIGLKVDSPMSETDYVTDVLVVADGNPLGAVAAFHFYPGTGVAEASTRIRLARSQNIIAVARMSDGSFYRTHKEVKVTIGGCGG